MVYLNLNLLVTILEVSGLMFQLKDTDCLHEHKTFKTKGDIFKS